MENKYGKRLSSISRRPLSEVSLNELTFELMDAKDDYEKLKAKRWGIFHKIRLKRSKDRLDEIIYHMEKIKSLIEKGSGKKFDMEKHETKLKKIICGN